MRRVRKEANICLSIPKGRKGIELAIPESDFAYGLPGKPSTPIKDIICNYYGDNAALQTIKRYQRISKIVFMTIIT